MRALRAIPQRTKHASTISKEAVPRGRASGFASFLREQAELILWGIGLEARIEEALDKRDKRLFQESVRRYKQVRQSCFWEL